MFCAGCVGYYDQHISYSQYGNADGQHQPYPMENIDLSAYGAEQGGCGTNDPITLSKCINANGDTLYPGMMVASTESTYRPGWAVCGDVDTECAGTDPCEAGVYGVSEGDDTTPGTQTDVYGPSDFMTSGATAQLSGLAGLVAAAFPDFGPDEIEAKIIASADNIDAGDQTVLGQIDVLSAGSLGLQLAFSQATQPVMNGPITVHDSDAFGVVVMDGMTSVAHVDIIDAVGFGIVHTADTAVAYDDIRINGSGFVGMYIMSPVAGTTIRNTIITNSGSDGIRALGGAVEIGEGVEIHTPGQIGLVADGTTVDLHDALLSSCQGGARSTGNGSLAIADCTIDNCYFGVGTEATGTADLSAGGTFFGASRGYYIMNGNANHTIQAAGNCFNGVIPPPPSRFLGVGPIIYNPASCQSRSPIMKTKTIVRLLAAAAALCAASIATAAQDVALPTLEGSPEVVVITVGVSVAEHALLTATYQGAAVDVVPIHPETEEVILQVTACYAAGQPGAPLGLEARDYDGAAVPLTLVADKGADGPVRRVFGRALPELPEARRPVAPAAADEDVPAAPDFTIAPNPFNPSMRISFRGELGEFAMVNIYDLRGRMVNDLYSGPVRTRETELTWLGRDRDGRTLPSGVYFVHLFVGGREEVKKVMLAK